MTSFWHIQIEEDQEPLLSIKMLGLTFFERRLREARRYGISKVFFTGFTNKLSKLTSNPKHCAEFEITTAENLPKDASYFEIPALGMISNDADAKLLLEVKSIEDFSKAKKFIHDEITNNSGAGWIGRKLNKFISIPISSMLSYTKLTPNVATFGNMLVGIACAYFAAQQGYVSGLMGGFLLQLASVLDGVDGEIAKYRLETSPLGAILDSISDNGTFLAFMLGILYYWKNKPGLENSSFVLCITIGAILLAVLYIAKVWHFSSKHLGSNSLVSIDTKFLALIQANDWALNMTRKLKDLIKKDFYSFFFFLCCAVGFRELVFYSVIAGAFIGLILIFYITTKYHPLPKDSQI